MTTSQIINVFSSPFESWSYRQATQQEAMDHFKEQGFLCFEIKEYLVRRIGTAFEAAEHMIRVRVDNALENFIDDALVDDVAFNALRDQMPLQHLLHSMSINQPTRTMTFTP